MGVPGNERADELAREGSSTLPIGPHHLFLFLQVRSRTRLGNYASTSTGNDTRNTKSARRAEPGSPI